jgi:hypothetical protein
MSAEERATVMDRIGRRMDAMLAKLRKSGGGFFDQKSWKWKLAIVFLALWGVILPTCQVYHFNGLANEMSRQSLLEAQWANYYTWLLTVCPAEQVCIGNLLLVAFQLFDLADG